MTAERTGERDRSIDEEASSEACPRCRSPLPAQANFCPNCGAPVAVPAASERRVVTVVFADLAGSTELAAKLDPERFRDVLAAFHGMVTDEITTLGGRAEGFIGDAVLGVFGVPVLHDDDAERGVRAGLAIVDRAGRIGARLELPVPVGVRVGVNTGPVAVGTQTDRSIVIGAEVNMGARLQQAARPGEVLVGQRTRLLVGDAIEFGEPRMIEAKGFEEAMPAWQALGVVGPQTRRSISLVNRRRELALLSDTFERVRVRERSHLVTLVGEPGIGKTRVVEEFLAGLPDNVRVLAGRSSAFEESVTFWPLAQMVYREIGTDRRASEDEVSERLRDWVREWVPADEVDEAARRVGMALGVEGDLEEERYHAAELRRGLLSVLTGLAAHGPVVLVFDDMHEAYPLLLDLIEQLVKEARKMPLMVLCVARWEFLALRPNWAGGIADSVTMWVEPLTPGHAAELAMEAGGLRHDDADRVAAHAGGNPYFIVEIVGMLRREERDLPPWGPAPSGRLLPPTVQAVIATRIDQLTPAARELVRRASVFPGGRFDLDELALLVEPRQELLDEAEDEELLTRDEDRPGLWRFGSDVLRDVAYESLAKRERQRLHLRVANKLSEGEQAERFPRTAAYHLEQAAQAALDLNPGDRTLAERAVDALAHAGDNARQRMESRSAADMYERALAMAGPEERWGDREAWILSVLGEARYWLGEFEAAEPPLRRALSLGGASSDRVASHASRFLADITHTIHGDDEAAEALFDRSLLAARRLGQPHVLARTLLMSAWAPSWVNDLSEAEVMFREALEAARSVEGGDAWAESRSLVGIASVISPSGDEEEALRVGLEALDVGEQAGQAFASAVANATVGASLRHLLRLDEGLEHMDAAIGTFRELGARWELASALGDRGAIYRLAGRLEEAERDAREAFVLCRDLRERSLVTLTAAELARILAARGDAASAHQVLSEPAAHLVDDEPASEAAWLNAQSLVALLEGDEVAARAKARAAIDAGAGTGGAANAQAAQVWWAGRLFGPEEVGGPRALSDAHDLLEHHHWLQALLEPDLAADLRG
ncbi:MAG: AAA family ATPase [Actinomycetota bacterium]|nr:AAA family ATPase [Actinomycetota bacterium]